MSCRHLLIFEWGAIDTSMHDPCIRVASSVSATFASLSFIRLLEMAGSIPIPAMGIGIASCGRVAGSAPGTAGAATFSARAKVVQGAFRCLNVLLRSFRTLAPPRPTTRAEFRRAAQRLVCNSAILSQMILS